MAVQVPDTTTFSLQDVKDYDSFVFSPPNDLVAAIALANQSAQSIPFLTRWDGRYFGSRNSLLNFRCYGAGGFDDLNRVFGSHLTSFNFETWVGPFTGLVSRQFIKVDEGSGTAWFSVPLSASGIGQIQRTVTMDINNTGTARNGGLKMRITVGGTNVFESRTLTWNQPSL